MPFIPGKPSVSLEDLLKVTTEAEIATHYLGINKIPCVIQSPLRRDNHPSFGIYSPNGTEVNYIDFCTSEGGTIFTLLSILWNIPFSEVISKIYYEFNQKEHSSKVTIKSARTQIRKSDTNDVKMECKVRDWLKHDITYWESYGISLDWLKYAEVYPISHKIITKEGQKYIFGADKYAYAFVERKEGNITLKIYQPFNKSGFKWSNKHDRSVISLWSKIPNKGDKVCICSSLKDALCLWANTGIPSIAIQGEGYGISNTAADELRKRFVNIYICLDNDKIGLLDAEKLASKTNFINVVLPQFKGGKDISDLYKIKGKKEFLKIILSLFNNK